MGQTRRERIRPSGGLLAAPALPAGRTRAAAPYTGRTVEVYRNRYDGGRLLETRPENVSVCRSRDRVVLVSPADRRKYGL